jgi:hypothetical protein
MRRASSAVAGAVLAGTALLAWRFMAKAPPPVTVASNVLASQNTEAPDVPTGTESAEPSATPKIALPPSSDATKPESEEAFLRELARLRTSDPERALAFAQKGDDWYPSVGKAAEARKATVVTLLVELGRMEQARALTRGFIAAYPSSEYRSLVQGVTGVHPRPHGPDGVEY